MQIISRVEEETGDMLVWCSEDFDVVSLQKTLHNAGLSLLNIRTDHWASVCSLKYKEVKDTNEE